MSKAKEIVITIESELSLDDQEYLESRIKELFQEENVVATIQSNITENVFKTTGFLEPLPTISDYDKTIVSFIHKIKNDIIKSPDGKVIYKVCDNRKMLGKITRIFESIRKSLRYGYLYLISKSVLYGEDIIVESENDKDGNKLLIFSMKKTYGDNE